MVEGGPMPQDGHRSSLVRAHAELWLTPHQGAHRRWPISVRSHRAAFCLSLPSSLKISEIFTNNSPNKQVRGL